MYVNCACSNLNLEHWLFLGLSVKNYSNTFNSLKEGGSLRVELVEDTHPPCPNHPKKYLNNLLEVSDWTLPDPGFLGLSSNIIGLPVVFKHGDFEYSGIINNFEKTESSGGVIYTVDLVSPYFFLDNVSVILGDYNMQTNYVPNVMNVYGLWEGTSCNSFGTSFNNGDGMPWNRVREGIMMLAGTITNITPVPISNYMYAGRIIHKAGTNAGFGVIPESSTGYILDLFELPETSTYYRINGNVSRLSEIIDTFTEDAGLEYFTELYVSKLGGVIYKIIKIRVIDRTGPINPGSLLNFVNSYDNECGVISKTLGEESRNETLHHFVIGPPKQQMYWVEWERGSLGSFKADQKYWNPKEDDEDPPEVDPSLPIYTKKELPLCDINGEPIVRCSGLCRYECIDGELSVIASTCSVIDDCLCNYEGLPCSALRISTWGQVDKSCGAELTTTTTPNPDKTDHPGRGSATLEIDRYNLSQDLIQPYWGLNIFGDAILSYADDWYSYIEAISTTTTPIPGYEECRFSIPHNKVVHFYANTTNLGKNSSFLNPPPSLLMSELELMAALQGRDQWENYIETINTETNMLFKAITSLEKNARSINNIAHIIDKLNPDHQNLLKPRHILNIKKVGNAAELDDPVEEDFNILYNWVKEIADTYYGKQYMVRVPEVCVKIDPDTGLPSFNLEPVDGGWNEVGGVEYPNLIGLDTTDSHINFFRNEDGTIGAFVRFDAAFRLNLSNLQDEDYGYRNFDGTAVWVRCDVEKEFVWGDHINYTDPRVVIKLPGRVFYNMHYHRYDEKGYILSMLNPVYSQFWPSYSVGDIGKVGKITQYDEGELEFAVQPNAIAIPMLNRLETYGPWYASSSLIGGKTEVIYDTTMAPWNFNSLVILNYVGLEIATSGVSTMFSNESGSIQVPGIPKSRLGEEVLAFDGSGYVAGQRFFTTRISSEYNSSVAGVNILRTDIVTSVWSGLLGPIITSISTSIGEDGATTTYSFSLYSKGFRRFSRAKIERQKEVGQLRQEMLNRIKNG
jgi:hypothetical protein